MSHGCGLEGLSTVDVFSHEGNFQQKNSENISSARFIYKKNIHEC